MESSCPTKSHPPSASVSSADSATTSTNEIEADDVDVVKAHTKVEERLEYVLFRITDYLAEIGRRDLFKSLTMTDLAAMIYNPRYIRWLREKVPETML